MAKSKKRRYLLVLTGRRRNGRHRVVVNGRDVSLSGSRFEALCELAYRKAIGEGFVAIDKMTISRLRQAVDDATSPGVGRWLIESGADKDYHLAVPRAKIAVDESFFELASTTIPPALRRVIRRAYATVTLK